MSQATEFSDYKLNSGITYSLTSELMWDIGIKDSGWQLVIPESFSFDISIPKALWWLVSPHHEPWLLASCIHDRLLNEGFDRSFAAGEWYRAAKAMEKYDDKSWLVLGAYYAIVLWTVR